MVEDRENSRQPRVLPLGPARTTAIAGLITALSAAGFFDGRATAPRDNTGPTPGQPTAFRTPGPSPTTTLAAPVTPSETARAHHTVDISDAYGVNITDEPGRPQKIDGTGLDLAPPEQIGSLVSLSTH